MRLSKFVVYSHVKHHPANEEELQRMAKADDEDNEVNHNRLPQTMLRKYIKYARTHICPKLQNIDTDKLTQTYIELRREAAVCDGTVDSKCRVV